MQQVQEGWKTFIAPRKYAFNNQYLILFYTKAGNKITSLIKIVTGFMKTNKQTAV